MDRFDSDTAVQRVAEDALEGRIDRGWWVVQGPNGGYVAALLLRALAAEVAPDRSPRSLTIHYLAPPAEGPIRVETRVERSGRSLTTVSGRAFQGERAVAVTLAAFSRARPGEGFQHVEMPEVAPPERCERFASTLPIHERYECRFAMGARPRSGAARASSGGWIRHAEPRLVDAYSLAAFADAWPPACFALVSGPEEVTGPVPTIDLTVHFRRALPLAEARPDDWVLAAFHTRAAHDGFIEEDGEIWSRDGTLLAQSRQLAIRG